MLLFKKTIKISTFDKKYTIYTIEKNYKYGKIQLR